jgi:hypothetical protein
MSKDLETFGIEVSYCKSVCRLIRRFRFRDVKKIISGRGSFHYVNLGGILYIPVHIVVCIAVAMQRQQDRGINNDSFWETAQ